MRVLITGSREGQDQAYIWSVLDEVFDKRPNRREIFLIVHGGAKGADTMARLWASGRRRDGELSIYHEMHQARWIQGGKFVKAAGHQRNQRMVDAGADLVLAFWDGKSDGTRGCIEAAERAGLEVKIHRIDQQEES